MNLRSKSILICDSGLYVSLALRLSRDFSRVGYHPIAWKRAFPGYEEHDIGTGFEEITPEPHLFKALDRYDMVWFPDVLHGDLQVFLRAHGYRVFGCGYGEELELNRLGTKKLMEQVGLPVGPYAVLHGMEELCAFLKTHKDWFVKLSLLRGITETFGSEEYWLIEPRLDELRHKLGMRKKWMEFIAEKQIKTKIELGYDGISIDGLFPKIAANGCEIKDVAYACVVQDYDRLPKGLRLVNEKLAPAMKASKYRNFFSSECREADDGKFYPIDLTTRQPSPAGESEQELWENLSEVAWEGAEGKLVELKSKAKYAVQSIIYGDRADESWQPIKFPEEFRDNIKLYHECLDEGRSYCLPQLTKMNEVGSVVTIGNVLKDVIKQNEEIAKHVTGDKITIRTDKISDVVKEFEEMEKQGIDLTPINL